jgi:flagellar hook-associated protein 2
MTTVSSSTLTPTPTPTSATSAATSQLLTSLGAGSGIDTAGLVSSLVTAQFDAQSTRITSQTDKLTAQISGVATLKNAVSTFATALDTLSKGGTLVAQPISGSAGVFTAAATGTAGLSNLNSTLAVTQLAGAQTAVSRAAFASSTATVGTGQLTLTLGQATYNADGSAMTGFTAGPGAAITIDITDGGLDKIAAAINARRAGVTATVVTDADGSAYLSLKGASGKAQGFTLSATSTTGDLSRLAVGPGATGTAMTSTAKNAKLVLDGVAVERASNTVSDLVPGVKLQLTGVSGTPVSLTSTSPTDALKNAVTDLVDTYNEVIKLVAEQTNPVTGTLGTDTGVRTLRASLGALTSRVLLPGAADGMPRTLAAIGVRTNRDGSLEVDSDALTRALRDSPASVEAMFAATADGTGLAGVVKSISLAAGSTLTGLGASTSRYIQQQSALSKEKDKLDDAKTAATTRMTQQFASMNSRVNAYKSTQTFLTNQIAAWNKSDS